MQRVEATVHAAEIALHPVRRPWARTTGLLAVGRCHRRRRVRTVLVNRPSWRAGTTASGPSRPHPRRRTPRPAKVLLRRPRRAVAGPARRGRHSRPGRRAHPHQPHPGPGPGDDLPLDGRPRSPRLRRRPGQGEGLRGAQRCHRLRWLAHPGDRGPAKIVGFTRSSRRWSPPGPSRPPCRRRGSRCPHPGRATSSSRSAPGPASPCTSAVAAGWLPPHRSPRHPDPRLRRPG